MQTVDHCVIAKDSRTGALSLVGAATGQRTGALVAYLDSPGTSRKGASLMTRTSQLPPQEIILLPRHQSMASNCSHTVLLLHFYFAVSSAKTVPSKLSFFQIFNEVEFS